MATIIKPRRGLKSELTASILADNEFVILTDDQSAYYQHGGVKTKITDLLFFPGYIDFPGLANSYINLTGNLATGNDITIGNITITAGTDFAIGATMDLTGENISSVLNSLNIVSGSYNGLIKTKYDSISNFIKISCDEPGIDGNSISTGYTGLNLNITTFTGGSIPPDDKLYFDLLTKRMYIYFNGFYYSIVAEAVSTISSLFSELPDTDLVPIYEYQGQSGLFEINANGDVTPSNSNNPDLFYELNVYNDISPKS